MQAATNRGTTIKAVCVILLVLFMFSNLLSFHFQLLEHTQATGSGSSPQQTFLFSTSGTFSGFMEIAREVGGVTGTDISNNDERGTRMSFHFFVHFLLAALYITRMIIPSGNHRFFPFQNNIIHSRSIILCFIERQDGSKIR